MLTVCMQIGINYYTKRRGTKSELRSCVSDAKNMHKLLIGMPSALLCGQPLTIIFAPLQSALTTALKTSYC